AVAVLMGVVAFFLAPQGGWKVVAGVVGASWVALGTLRFVWTRVSGRGARMTAEMLGMTLAHLGVSVFLVGTLLVGGLQQEHEVAVKPGQMIEPAKSSGRFDGVAARNGPNFQASYGTVLVLVNDRPLALPHPDKRTDLAGN